MMTREPDVLDLLILGILEDEGRISTTVLAARAGLTERECEERVIGLELDGHIAGYTIIRNFPDPGLGPLSACIRIVMAPGPAAAARAEPEMPANSVVEMMLA